MGMYTKTIKFQVTIPASQPANSLLVGSNAQIIENPLVGALNEFPIPSTETWVIKDIYVAQSPAIDVQIKIKKNRKYMLETPPVSSLLVSNPSRPRLPALLYEPNARLSIEAINLAAGGTSATTVTVQADVDIYTPD
jgi:hypothetical protein